MSAMFSAKSKATIDRVMVVSLVCIGLALGITARAHATPVVLTFEGVGDSAFVEQFYNGGTDSNGSSGTNYGIEFGPGAVGMIDFAAGGGGQWTNEPSPVTVLLFLPWVGSSTMNVAAGFDAFSFFYSGIGPGTRSISIYDGLNATGNILATLSLTPSVDGNLCMSCVWTEVNATFSGTAHSVDFTDSDAAIGFDNLTLNFATPDDPTGVPEPGALGTMTLGLALLATLYRRRRRS